MLLSTNFQYGGGQFLMVEILEARKKPIDLS